GRRSNWPRSSASTPLITASPRARSSTSPATGVGVGEPGMGVAVGLGVGFAGEPGVGLMLGVGLMFEVRLSMDEPQPRMKPVRAENKRGSIKYRQRTFPPTVTPPNNGGRSNDSRETHVLLGVLRLRLDQTLASWFI